MDKEHGICLCHGIEVEGVRHVSRPKPYPQLSVFGGDDPKLVLLIVVDNDGYKSAHEIPYEGQ